MLFGGAVTGFFEESEHVAFVVLDAGLVEWVHAKHVSADSASALEEVDELTDNVLGQAWELDVQVGYIAVKVSHESSFFGHFVDIVDVFAGDVVKAVEVVSVVGNGEAVVNLVDRNDGFEYGAFALLNHLAH